MGKKRRRRLPAMGKAMGIVTGLNRLIDRVAAGLLALAAVVVPLVMLSILISILAASFGINPLATFDRTWPLLGDRLSIQGLGELQWHLFALLVALGAGAVLWTGGHVRVDVLNEALPPRARTAIDLIGHLLFALPALYLMTGPAWNIVARSMARGEASPDGGLIDRWMVKGALWLLLALLLAFALLDFARKLVGLVRPGAPTAPTDPGGGP